MQIISSAKAIEFLQKNASDVPAPSPLIHQVLELLEREDSTADSLSELLAGDPVVAAKTLQVVNSAYYGMQRQVDNLGQAAMILGFTQLRNLVLSICATSLVKPRTDREAVFQQRVWADSIVLASIASQLAEARNMSRAEQGSLFLSGLMFWIGQLLFAHVNFDKYTEILVASKSMQELQIRERNLFGFDHLELNVHLFNHWNFPRSIVGPIEELATEEGRMCSIGASLLIVGSGYALESNKSALEFEVVDQDHLDRASVSPEEAGAVMTVALATLSRLQETLNHAA